MSKEKQIEEMARFVCSSFHGHHDCENCSLYEERCCVSFCAAKRLYGAGYRKQSEGEWISVEERLPDCEYGAETEALLFRLKTGTVEAGYFGTGGRFRDKYFRCYHHANEGWDAKDVTHWMPLPEPPKEI